MNDLEDTWNRSWKSLWAREEESNINLEHIKSRSQKSRQHWAWREIAVVQFESFQASRDVK